MSKSLQIDCEWIDQPAAFDPLERKTWARISITVGGRSATRIWDRETRGERTGLYIPAYPIALWIVQNWWAPLHETVPAESVPVATNNLLPEAHRDWISPPLSAFGRIGNAASALVSVQVGQRNLRSLVLG
jgi:hypothetical protein